MASCAFCDLIAGKSPRTLVWEDADTIVINDIHPGASTHLLVIPKKHVPDLLTMSDEGVAHLMLVVKKIITEKGISRYRIVHNGGGAQVIDHAHIHIMGSVDPHRNL